MIFMGGEFAQSHEWRHDFSLDWHEAEGHYQQGVQAVLKDLNALYRESPRSTCTTFRRRDLSG